MRTRSLLLIVACLLAAALLAMWAASRAGAGTLAIAIVDHRTDKSGAHSVRLLITNDGPYRICYPDGFFVETRGVPGRAYVPTTNLWLDPGDHAAIQVALPVIAGAWCGVVSYYAESPWNRLKMRLSSSSIGGRVPSAFSTVQGAEVKSPWTSY